MSTDNKGLVVRPEKCDMDFIIRNHRLQLIQQMLDLIDGRVEKN